MKKIQQNCIQCIRPISELRTRDRCYVGKNFTHSMRFTEFLKKTLYRQLWFKWSIFIGGKKFQSFELWNYQFGDIPDILWKKLFVQVPFCIEEGGSLRRGWISDFKLENVQNELKLRIRKKWIDLIFESIRNSRN